MGFKSFVMGAALCVFSASALAQDAGSDRQLEAMARLAPLAGDWTVTGRIMGPEGAQALEPGEARTRYAFNDRGLEDNARLDLGGDGPTHLRTLFSYDPYRGLYRLSVMDDTFGLLDIYEGDFDEDGRLVVTNLRTDTSYPIEGGQLHFKLVYDFTHSDGHDFDVYMSADRGTSWALYFDQRYTLAD